MTSEAIAFHPKTVDIALFRFKSDSDYKYWIGSYDKHLTHQSAEPPYVLIRGYFENESEAMEKLLSLTGDEF